MTIEKGRRPGVRLKKGQEQERRAQRDASHLKKPKALLPGCLGEHSIETEPFVVSTAFLKASTHLHNRVQTLYN